ncbi:MAG: DJ-1/PfpI family protein [Saprospiraceae bacterium]|nr:DJ-1/PfpI family protein [Bacteroidia bacterium]NNL91046.1 DJ-1/PfpI family protein [Saprospiraceae bacterium]
MEDKIFIIAIPVYDRVDLMDIAAPREIFKFAGSEEGIKMEVYYVGEPDPNNPEIAKQTVTRCGLLFTPDKTFDAEEVSNPSLIWVPGGAPDKLSEMLDKYPLPFFNYIEEKGKNAAWVTSVCEGAILLAKTGLLDGYKITTHYAFYPCMAAFPKVKLVKPCFGKYPRYIKDRNRITGGGISSGLDEAIYIVKLIKGKKAARNVQKVMQYYPKPPVKSKLTKATSCPVKGL